jgi:hypothetical protein
MKGPAVSDPAKNELKLRATYKAQRIFNSLGIDL